MKLIPDNKSNDPEFVGFFSAKNSDTDERIIASDNTQQDHELEDEELKLNLERLRAWFSIHL